MPRIRSLIRTADVTTEDRIGPRLKVWWIPQVPMKSFDVFCDSFAVAKALLDSLAQYDLFQFENNIKPDYCNTGGLCIWEESLEADENGQKWTDWESEACDSIQDISMSDCWELDRAHYNATLESATK